MLPAVEPSLVAKLQLPHPELIRPFWCIYSMNTVHSELGDLAPGRRGRPPRSKVDLFRERVLMTVLAQLPSDAPQCQSDRSAALCGAPLTRKREVRIADHFPVFAEVCRWPLHLLETRSLKPSRLRGLIETYECEPSYLLSHRRIELPASSDGQVVFFPARDPASLLWRGDLYGYLALLTQFRLSELNGDVATQWTTARYLARSLPGACQHPAIARNARTLISLTMRLLRLLPHPCIPVRIDRHQTLALVRSGLSYRAGSTPDPLVHYTMRTCTSGEATLLIPHC